MRVVISYTNSTLTSELDPRQQQLGGALDTLKHLKRYGPSALVTTQIERVHKLAGELSEAERRAVLESGFRKRVARQYGLLRE